MLSIIICSISEERLTAVKQNFLETVGDTETEFVIIDNREKGWPIAKAYNYGAEQAKYPNLFFVHEDVLFYAKGWGPIVERKLAEPTCGVIGFAGSKVKLKAYSSWFQNAEWAHLFNCQRIGGLWIDYDIRRGLEKPFQETLVLDGLGLFVRKIVWKENPFDELLLTEFHCCDIDFTLQIARSYKNYVCSSPLILIEHSSGGNYSSQWFADTIRMHKCKWNHFLPMMTSDICIEEHVLRDREGHAFYSFVFNALRSNGFTGKKALLIELWKRLFSWKHLSRCLVCSLKYIRGIRIGK